MSPSTKTISYRGGALVLQHKDEPDVFNGRDPETGDTFSLAVDQDVDVSAEVADQLADAHPGCFAIDGKVAGKRPSRKQAASDDSDLRDQLLAHKRDELDAAAKKLGIEAPEAMSNKAAVVDAIVAARSAA